MQRVKHTVGNSKDGIVAQYSVVTGKALQIGAIRYSLGNGFSVAINPDESISDGQLKALRNEYNPQSKETKKQAQKEGGE